MRILRRLFMVALLLVSSPAWATYGYVQGAFAAASTAVETSWSAGAFSTNTTAGNLIAWFFTCNDAANGPPTITVSDTAGNTFTTAGTLSDTTNHEWLGWGYAANIKGGADTVNVAISPECTYVRLMAMEYSGLSTSAPFTSGQVASQTQTSIAVPTATNGVSSGNTPTLASQPAALIGFSEEVSNGDYVAAGTGFSVRLDGSSTAYGQTIEDKALTSTSAVAATFTSPGPGSSLGTFETVAMVLNQASGGGSCTNAGYEPAGGVLAVPNGTSGSFLSGTGTLVTPNCSSVTYYQPVGGKLGVN